jgi:hypothetical protein
LKLRARSAVLLINPDDTGAFERALNRFDGGCPLRAPTLEPRHRLSRYFGRASQMAHAPSESPPRDETLQGHNRGQARFMAEGVEGLTRDKTRKPGKKPLPAATVQNVVDLALGPPPGEATHWTGRMLAKSAGVSLRSVQRILEAHQLAPHRISSP